MSKYGEIEFIDTSDLTHFLLNNVRRTPSIYLKNATISNLSIFLSGYQCSNPTDKYFSLEYGFLKWYYNKKGINEVYFSTWEYPFLLEASDDEFMALQLYFKYLQEYCDFLS